MMAQEEYLDQLAPTLQETMRIGETMCGSLVEQTAMIDDLHGRSERTHQQTNAVIRKAGRITQVG